MLDIPPAYFYTQPGATGPGTFDNMAPQSWQVRPQTPNATVKDYEIRSVCVDCRADCPDSLRRLLRRLSELAKR